MTGPALVSSLLALACVLLPLCAAQGSCVGRCGEPFTRGQICNCDYNCFVHGECCKDFDDVCTASDSCRGRCGEPFRRGRQCECDSDCVLHNTCCPDYSRQCDAFTNLQAARSSKPNKPTDYTEECMAACLAAQQSPDLMRDGTRLNNFMAPSEVQSLPAGGPLPQDIGLHASLTPSDIPGIGSNPSGFPLPSGFLLPESGPAPSAGPLQAGGPSSGNPLTLPVQVSLSISEQGDGPSSGPASGSGRPSTLVDIAQAMATSSPAGADANSDPDLCSGLVIDAMAALFNGTVIVFRGHFFWLLNPKTKRVGPARRITEELGIPSPIDTAFTRCNCQGKTYIIKGDNYWSFENGVKEPGYPRSVSQDFGGLTGVITAALPVPATRKKPESVYFFKKGGTIQKFFYPPGSGPTCSGKRSKNSVYAKIRRARQAEIQLSGEINIKLKMKGFPTPVTSAMSMPNPKKSDGFDYFVLSWPKVFNIKISGELPALSAPVSHSSQQNDISKWLNCA
ncbi:proteoglycan 4-like isoform X1 [Ctenopharyngodon idella]|uniref:proteoglycan 4-like isoform X1 n=1 Tax=Ctenopharyngodon idella TaxID=7959 RepID=UPI0022300B42|nr:proteoglycan 4-like isoform X1 [Ctenopharyngodon idella]XP_051768366.1 proteoglycan 4-like isoform X1 [Ctenopharyngodon idella]